MREPYATTRAVMSRIDIFNHEYGINPLKPYASRIFNCSVAGANTIGHLADGRLPRDTWLAVVMEFMYFYIALTKGHVLKDLTEDRRDTVTSELVNVLFPQVVDYIFDPATKAHGRALKKKYVAMAFARLEIYEGYRLLMAATEDELQGTGLGSLCESVADLSEHPGNTLFEETCYSHIHKSMAFLRIKSFVASVA